jgi:hypothetical protein
MWMVTGDHGRMGRPCPAVRGRYQDAWDGFGFLDLSGRGLELTMVLLWRRRIAVWLLSASLQFS